MGNDGGSIPKRRELVKSAARAATSSELKETALESLTHAWSFCPLTSTPLDPSNTVSDYRGLLYNYESILQCLLPSGSGEAEGAEAQIEEAFMKTGIKTLKDVQKLRFSMRQSDKGEDIRACPVSLKELGASTKAVYIVPCGHVFAELSMKEISGSGEGAAEKRCPECSEAFESDNVIPILSTSDAEANKLETRMEDLKVRGLTHSLKKDKSGGKKKRKAEEATNSEASTGTNGKDGKKEKRGKREKGLGIESRINNPMTASLTAKVLAEQEENNKRRKIAAVR
ncbi:Rtf2 RING-finger-domain-containing protein [Xylariales sp. AK1849]|nr:Rtf2 RING-finger-domain-containing protein [Xylariales sp. AK1849]